MILCPLCKKPSYPHKDNVKNLCYFHFCIDLFQHNDNLDRLGIISFAFTLFGNTEAFRRKWGVSKMHREMLWEFLYDEPGWRREDRAHVIAAFKGAAKTTWFSWIVPLYFGLMNNYGVYVGSYKLPRLDYIVIRSATSNASQKILFNIINAFQHTNVVSLFGQIRPTLKEIKARQSKDTAKLLITANGFILESLSIEQQLQGANILNKRPKVVIYDDAETKHNTKTEDRRKNNAKSVLEESWGALDEEDGRMLYIGNMVHEDCLLKNLLANPQWKKKFYTVTYKDENGEHLTWPGKYKSLDNIARIKRFYESHQLLGLAAFYRNYYNINKTDVNPIINKIYDVEYVRHQNLNWIKYVKDGKQIIEHAYITVGYDASVTQRSSGSKTSILVLAQTSSKKKFILDYKYGAFDTHDRYLDIVPEKERPPVLAIEPTELAKVYRYGGIEESVRMIIKYNADAFAMGTEAQQLGFYNDIVDIIGRLNLSVICVPIATAGRNADPKVVRLRDSIMRQFEQNIFYLCGDMPELVAELETFPQSKLDILDSLYYADRVQVVPPSLNEKEEHSNTLRSIAIPEIKCEESWVIDS